MEETLSGTKTGPALLFCLALNTIKKQKLQGCIDARGMVRVTGRYKELIIGAGGENVAPVPGK